MTDTPGESTGLSSMFPQELDIPHHDTIDRHEFGKAFPIPSAPSALGATAKAGSSLAPARADHVHPIPTSSVRRALIYASPVLSAGNITLGVSGQVLAASLVTVPSATYNRFAQISATGSFSYGTTTVYRGEYVSISVQVDGTPTAGSGFGVQPIAGTQIPFVRNQYNTTTVTANWSGHRELLAGFSWAFQLNIGSTDTTYSVNAGSFRMSILVIPEYSMG